MPVLPRIAIAGFQHETNSFTSHRANYQHFCLHRDRPPLVRGEALIESLRGGTYAMSGVIEEGENSWELLPLLWTSGGAGGVVTADAFERISSEMMDRLSQLGQVDGLYLDLHGAMVAERYDDAEGELLRRARAIVGSHVPIVVSLDYHANLSQTMLDFADTLITCKTYPHVDRKETGHQAARILRSMLEKQTRPNGRALRRLPFILPIEFQCTLVEPSRQIAQWIPHEHIEIFDASYAAGFPASDTVACGPAVVVYAHTQQVADAAADAYLAFACSREGDFSAEFWSLKDGVTTAISRSHSAKRPIIIADTQDNPGAGGSGDTTGILHELRAQNAQDALVGYFCDPNAARLAFEAGVGARVALSLGARNERNDVTPFEAEFEVISCADHPFLYTGAVAGNVMAELGKMALVRTEGIVVAITERVAQAYDAAPFEQLGADPSGAALLVLKSSCHFRAVFEPLADDVLIVLAPGNYQPDPKAYDYKLVDQAMLRLPGQIPPAARTPCRAVLD